ncbi:MAG: hypothetical protein ACRDQ2_10575, partial [Gaiellales bacterium]
MHTLPRIEMASLIELVNEYAAPTRLAADLRGTLSYPALPDLDDFPTTESEMIDAADRLHPVFASPHTAPSTLNSLIAELGLQPRLDETGSLDWAVRESPNLLLGRRHRQAARV